MHPGDVVEFVAGEVDHLREQVANQADLGITEVDLEGVQLYIAFEKQQRALTTAVASTSYVGLGALPGGVPWTGIDLSQPPTRRPLVAHFDCSDFDGLPPTLELMTGQREILPPQQWPKGLDAGGIVPNHPLYKRPFLCRRGLREFHTHPEHEDQPWDRFRESLTLSQLVLEIMSDLQRKWLL